LRHPDYCRAGSTVDNPEKAIDKDLATYCQTASAKTLLDLECDRPEASGNIVCINVVLVYESNLSQAGGELVSLGCMIPALPTGLIAIPTLRWTAAAYLRPATLLTPSCTSRLPDTFTIRVNHVNRDATSTFKIYEVGLNILWQWSANPPARRPSGWQVASVRRACGSPACPRVRIPQTRTCRQSTCPAPGRLTDYRHLYRHGIALIERPCDIAGYLSASAGVTVGPGAAPGVLANHAH